ncbi:MAG: PCYCGC motif-containing (lipo)protein, partial [Nitrososphaerales archaeon]
VPATLDPESVLPRARAAYRVAKEYPRLIMQLPCFCGCEVEWGERKAHLSLLDCFTDRHGENCRICVNEAIFAGKGFEEGRKPQEIRSDLVESYGTPGG